MESSDASKFFLQNNKKNIYDFVVLRVINRFYLPSYYPQ